MIDEPNSEVLCTLRIKGSSFQPKTFKPATIDTTAPRRFMRLVVGEE